MTQGIIPLRILTYDRFMIYLLIAAFTVIADQIFKFYIRTEMYLGQSKSIIGDFFRLTYVRNDGAAFGLFSGQHRLLILIPLAIMVCILIFILKHRKSAKLLKFSLTLIASGGIGNCIDRMFMGYVTVMFDFSIFPPVFNIADIAVTLGCILVIVYVLRDIFKGDHNKSKK